MEEFTWEERHQVTFDNIKEYLSKPHVFMPTNESISCLLAQKKISKGHEHTVYYLSKVLNPVEIRYSSIEKLCLALYFACTKPRHYLIKS